MRIVLCLAFSLLLPASAWACSCVPQFTNSFVGPTFNAMDVPVNTRVWLGGAEATPDNASDTDELVPLSIVTGDGDPVSFTAATLLSDWRMHVVLTPDADLAPDTLYEVFRNGDEVIARFRTGFDRDDVPPPVPLTVSHLVKAESALPDPPSSCGATDGVIVEHDSDAEFVVGNLLGRAEFDLDTLGGEVTQLSSDGSDVRFISGGCSSAWPDVVLGSIAEWQLGAFDLAGNFSGWGEVETAEISMAEATASQNAAACADAGCSATGGTAGLLIPLLFAGRRRRR